jgi:nitroreductase
MEFFDVIARRRSIRAYQDRPVEREAIERILQGVNLAPSAGNLQAYDIFVIESDNLRKELAQAASNQEFLFQAPVVLVFCSNPSRNEWRYKARGSGLYCLQDATIACTYAMLAATALGLSTVWVGAFNDKLVLNVLGNPSGLTPVALLPIGYAAEESRELIRKPLKELVHSDQGGSWLV